MIWQCWAKVNFSTGLHATHIYTNFTNIFLLPVFLLLEHWKVFFEHSAGHFARDLDSPIKGLLWKDWIILLDLLWYFSSVTAVNIHSKFNSKSYHLTTYFHNWICISYGEWIILTYLNFISKHLNNHSFSYLIFYSLIRDTTVCGPWRPSSKLLKDFLFYQAYIDKNAW